jgi:hypothetical protein
MRKRYCIAILVSLLVAPGLSKAEPMIVFPGSMNSNANYGSSDSPFANDNTYSASHNVKIGDSLGSIMRKYYAGAGLDRGVLQYGIVKANSHVFRNSNANFMLAGKLLKLPSVNELQNMIFSRKTVNSAEVSGNPSKNVYFFGQ